MDKLIACTYATFLPKSTIDETIKIWFQNTIGLEFALRAKISLLIHQYLYYSLSSLKFSNEIIERFIKPYSVHRRKNKG